MGATSDGTRDGDVACCGKALYPMSCVTNHDVLGHLIVVDMPHYVSQHDPAGEYG